MMWLLCGTVDNVPYAPSTVIFIAKFMQLSDVFNSLIGITNSGIIANFTQVGTQLLVMWVGIPTYIIPMAAIWSFSDMTRYIYHVMGPTTIQTINPIHSIIESIKFNQYAVLYPIGITFELMTLLSAIDSPSIQVMVTLCYIIIFPKMYNHTSKLNEKRLIIGLLNSETNSRMPWTTRTIKMDDPKTIHHDTVVFGKLVWNVHPSMIGDLKSLLNKNRHGWKQSNNRRGTVQYTLTDFGIQIPNKIMALILHIGAMITFPAMIIIGNNVGWNELCIAADDALDTEGICLRELNLISRPDAVMWILHYLKRIYEIVMVHKFGDKSTDLDAVVLECLRFWTVGMGLGHIASNCPFDGDAIRHGDVMFFNNRINMHDNIIISFWVICQSINGWTNERFPDYLIRNNINSERIRAHWLFGQPNQFTEMLCWLCVGMLNIKYDMKMDDVYYMIGWCLFCIITPGTW
jgi:hypothetical protein